MQFLVFSKFILLPTLKMDDIKRSLRYNYRLLPSPFSRHQINVLPLAIPCIFDLLRRIVDAACKFRVPELGLHDIQWVPIPDVVLGSHPRRRIVGDFTIIFDFKTFPRNVAEWNRVDGVVQALGIGEGGVDMIRVIKLIGDDTVLV